MSPELSAVPRRIVHSLVRGSVAQRWAVMLAAALLTALAVAYTRENLGIDTDTTQMIDVRLPYRQANRALAAAFPELPGDIVVYTQAAHAGTAEDAANALAARLRERPDIARALSQPGGGEFFARNGLLYLSTDELWTLDARLAQAAPLLGTLAQDPSLRGLFGTLRTALTRPLDAAQQAQLGRVFERLASALAGPAAGSLHWRDDLFAGPAGSTPRRSFVLIDPARAAISFQPQAPALAALKALLVELQPQWPEVTFRLTGATAMDTEELVGVAADAQLTTLLSFALVAVVLMWGLRSPAMVLAVLLTLGCGLLWTAALATYWVGSLNIISVCFAVLFIGMGVDFGVQFAMRYWEECARGERGAQALHATANGAGGALVLAAVGAAISFATFVPTSYRGLAQLGVISSFSMLVALIANLTLLPALLSVLPTPRVRPRRAGGGGFARGLIRHAAAIRWTALALAAASVVLVPRAEFDPNPVNLKDPRSPAVRAFLELAADPSSSPYYIQILAPSLAQASRLGAELAQLPSVERAITLTSYVPGDQSEKLAIIDAMRMALIGVIDVAPEASPEPAAELAALAEFAHTLAANQAQLTLPAAAAGAERLGAALAQLQGSAAGSPAAVPALRARLLGDLPQTLTRLRELLSTQGIRADTLPSDVQARYVARDGRARVEVYARENLNDSGAMRRFVQAVRQVAPAASGAPVELVVGSEVVIDACIKASLAALVLTILLHAVVLHGWVDALLVAAPLVLAMLLTVATSVLLGFPFNFANIIALPLLIGLNNAYGAYLVVRRQHSAGLAPLLESSTPRAVMFSGLTAVASFGTLAVSQHPGMAGMGVLITLSLAYALASALIVLPALMHGVEAWRARR
ncbi:MAG: hypothetical protein EXR83_11875 [Gammaproteobacteria bacterium]|nr:hypothetical protein [Gammaproteobacteria bacterium]